MQEVYPNINDETHLCWPKIPWYNVIHCITQPKTMSKEIITLRIDSEKRIALDRLAQGFDRDRSYILNQAIDYYLQINQWQIAEIEQALLEAEAEDFVSQDDVDDLFKRLTNEN